MDQSTVENCSSSTVEEEAAAACAPPAAVHRRPRVREVSSRFMSPAPHPLPLKSPLAKHHHMSTPTSTLSEIQARQRSSSVNRQRRQLELEPLRCSDDTETPFPTKVRPVHVKPFKENGGGKQLPPQIPPQFDQFAQQQHRQHKQLSSSRPDTPMAMVATVSTVVTADRTPRSRHIHQPQRSTTPTAAAKLLQSSGLSSEANVRSSMPNEADLFEKSSTRVSASPCSRSLTFPLTSCDHPSLVPQNKACLVKPPVPPCAPPKLPSSDHLRKPKKVSSHQDYVHSLKLLHNRYLQWRFSNARAHASMRAQQRETERMLYSLALKVADLYDSVKTKRMELGLLLRTKTLSTILEAQIPYLDQWFALEEDYSIYLAEATQALLNASAQLPISANVKADVREVKEALNSAREVLEIVVFHVQRSMSKAEETENLISELARMVGGEKALIEECGNVLSKTYSKQVEEWSLRGQIIQL